MMQAVSYSPVVVSSGEEWRSVELTEEEVAAAIESAKVMKYYRLRDELNEKKRQAAKAEIMRPWSPEEMYGYVLNHRAHKCGFSKDGGADGKDVFVVDEDNEAILKALCYYFTNDPGFEQLCIQDESGTGYTRMNWRLKRGILLCGNVGTGKTRIMKLFAHNKRQCYDVMNTMQIASAFGNRGDTVIDTFSGVHRYDVKSANNFFQDKVGICFDDLGTEDDKQYYGNRANVMEQVLLRRYAAGLPFNLTHITTNYTAKALEEHYGPRVWSRILEMFNVVQLNGRDRRMGNRVKKGSI